MEKIERLLVVNRTSQYLGEEIHSAIPIARKYGSELLVLHLISNPVDMEALNAPLPYQDGLKKKRSLQEEAREELDKVLRRQGYSGVPVKIIVRDGAPADEIAQVVKEEKVDLIVLLAHQEGRLEHMLFGRENDEIIRSMPCSMLLVKKEPEPVVW